jgi:hypothetical protein
MAKKRGQKASEEQGPAAESAEGKGKRGRPKQGILNDPAFARIKEIEDVASNYVEARDRRQSLLADEVKLKERLIKVMKKNELTTYNFDGYMVELDHVDEDVVKVKKKRAARENASAA